MTLSAGIWALDGGQITGQLMRLFFRSATRNNEGIVEIGDLLVKALDVPGAAVAVGDGAAICRGKESLWQGSYWAYNLGSEQVDINPTAGSTRRDLVWLRIEDPTFSGSPWSGDPAEDVCASLVVTEGVSAGTKTVPSGKSGIPLALLTIPPSTATITSGMITDLRTMADPRTEAHKFALQGIWDPGTDKVGNTVDYEEFPNGAQWDIDVPSWAAEAVVSFTFYGLQYLKSGGNGSGSNYDARGKFQAAFGSLSTQDAGYWVRADVSEFVRVAAGGADTLTIPVAMRGTTQTLEIQGKGTENYRGSLEADGQCQLVVDVLFKEIPATDEPNRSPG